MFQLNFLLQIMLDIISISILYLGEVKHMYIHDCL